MSQWVPRSYGLHRMLGRRSLTRCSEFGAPTLACGRPSCCRSAFRAARHCTCVLLPPGGLQSAPAPPHHRCRRADRAAPPGPAPAVHAAVQASWKCVSDSSGATGPRGAENATWDTLSLSFAFSARTRCACLLDAHRILSVHLPPRKSALSRPCPWVAVPFTAAARSVAVRQGTRSLTAHSSTQLLGSGVHPLLITASQPQLSPSGGSPNTFGAPLVTSGTSTSRW